MTDLAPALRPSLRVRFERCWNTYVRIPLPWVRTTTARRWQTQKVNDPLGPDKFVELQESSQILIDEVVRQASGPKAPILDLGCNVGRHLNLLHKHGFTNLHGVDIQRTVPEHMAKVFPDLVGHVHLEIKSFQDYLPAVPHRFFEVVFTHGATVEVFPPSPWFSICRHMARVCGKAVVLVINENDHPYPRLWEKEFLRGGFLLTKLLRPVHPGANNSLLVFRRLEP